ncbi:hypothetical protein PSTG_00758 [Puccinia striiformis f. sp. tritici PST-78]|uniref:DUF6589 domain-containing protein n=1 Tax=Puccinia striiformis f. sp. tritici PST-78 TaxID=1165861 RepID=A0A0L0W413_9BASI|nr:hypothetical protein PSTG_00758 [Puccinia striiformis f. sp. tritici PST-78]
MFHGTWGYIHSASPSLLAQLKPEELTIDALNNALLAGSKLTIRPQMFTPTLKSTNHWEKALKSHITQVILRYIATAMDTCVPLQKTPPEVHPIPAGDPNIAVLKLMIASDNSAQGVGDVFTGFIQQSGLTPEEFHSRLQIIEGDLGSCNIFDTLKKQRCPAVENHESLNNVIAIPGAAHTLWNISQAIFLAHWGNEKDARDTGAWRTLHALAIQANKPVTKKDFNMMLCHIEKIHEATLLYCVLLVSNRAHLPISEDLLEVSSETIEQWVEITYNHFCAGESLRTDLAKTSPAHMNLLLRIRDFATVIEASRAMKAGDYGRLMYMWERWAVMTQGLGKMPHYSKHLPKLIVQLKHVLPKSVSQLVLNTLLISPTSRAEHFMATDQHLEQLNYWLKYFFNHSGIGTKIDRLVDVFSSNIKILIKLESGAEVVHQSHKNRLTVDSINNFRRMAENERMGQSPPDGRPPLPIADAYRCGIIKLQQEFVKTGLARFRPEAPGALSMHEEDHSGEQIMRLDTTGSGELEPHQDVSDESGGEEANQDEEEG